jgi:cysteine-rich repeat protein
VPDRSWSHPLAALGPILLGGAIGCWTGAQAEGLPCETNAQCGRGQECIDGWCGGEPSSDLCGNGVTDPGEECDEGEANADSAACKADCTAQACGDGRHGEHEGCDDGNTDDGDGCSSVCVLESCGNGESDPGEECDEGEDNADEGSCTTACLLPACGDGFVQPSADEDCDEGEATADCDADCTVAECGDQTVNAAAGEDCDNDSPAADDIDCMSSCTPPLLWDDMEPGTDSPTWTHEKVSGGPMVEDEWAVTGRNAQGERSWDSGVPANTEGDTRLVSTPVDLSGLDGQEIELRFTHARVFSDCGQPGTHYEGAVVEISENGGAFAVIEPDDGYGGPVGDMLCMASPLDGEMAFVGDASYSTETFDLSEFAGSEIRVGFRVAWDCGNCDMDLTAKGWFVDDVVVWRR